MARRALSAALTVATTLTALTACSSAAGSTAAVSVVASTNVYGALVSAIGGSAVSVTSLISTTAQDPHTYEASARDELAVRRADLVIANGGGYDDFMAGLVRSSGSSATVLSAVQLTGHGATPDSQLNEHVWYDLAGMQRLVRRLVATLSVHDREDAGSFAARGRRLGAQIATLQRTEAGIRDTYAGTGVAITEPVPLYLLSACGLVNRTPPAFSAAVESDTGVAAAVLRSTLQLFERHTVALLVYNAQTAGPETSAVLHQAREDSVSTVPVDETMPAGDDYVSWMRGNLAAVERALHR